MVRWIGIILVVVSLAAGRAFGGEITVGAALSDTRATVGDSVTLHVVVDGASDAAPPASLAVDGCEVEYLGGQNQSSQSTTIINGVRRDTKTERYLMRWRITPLRAGEFQIPPIDVEVAGQKHATPALALSAGEPKESDDFRLELALEKDEAYVGEPIRATLTWTLANTDVRDFRIIGNDGGKAYDVAPAPGFAALPQEQPGRPNIPFFGGQVSGRVTQQDVGGRRMTVLTTELLVTPNEAGEVAIGPFRVSFMASVGQRRRTMFDSPFDDTAIRERRVCTAPTRTLRVGALPTEGRPADFTGLVGRFALTAESSASEASVGDPITLTLRVVGTEPLSRVSPPDLSRDAAITGGFRVASDGWQEGKGGKAGERVFTTTIRPTSPSVTEIPAMGVSYFDSKSGAYATAKSQPIPLKVRATREVTAVDAERGGGTPAPRADARLLIAGSGGLKANYALETLGSGESASWADPRERAGAIAGVALLPPAMVGAIALWRWRARMTPTHAERTRRAASRAARRLARSRTVEDVAREIREFLGLVHGSRADAMTSVDAARLPGPAGVSLAEVLEACERTGFEGRAGDLESLTRRAAEALHAAARHEEGAAA